VIVDGRRVGIIGSACRSPAHGPIALAVLRREAEPGDAAQVGPGNASARVTTLPFGPGTS
jgi:tRNA-modifying protein YgfZ